MARRRTAVGIGVGAAALGAAPAAEAAIIEVENLSNSGTGSLRQAITDANANPDADEIVFDSSLSGRIFLQSALPTITQPLEINGPGADEVAVDAYYANARVFNVDVATVGDPVAFRGIEVAYGTAPGSGGGIRNFDSELTVENALVVANQSNAAPNPNPVLGGGGISEAAVHVNGSGTVIEDSAIVFNSAPQAVGGGIGSVNELGEIINSTIAENETGVDGGGVFAQSATLQNSTIAANEAASDGGGIASPTAGGNSVTLENSIVAGNDAVGIGPDVASTDPVTADFTLIGDDAGATINTTVTGSNLLDENPGLGYLGFYGGPTPTMAPAYDSPVIDQGRAAGGVTTDQRGETRPFDVTGIANSAASDGADMGAVELTDDETSPADLSLEMTDSPSTVFVGDQITYTLEVANDGPEDATGVELGAFLPGRVTVNSAGPGCTTTPDAGDTLVECVIGSLVSGNTQTRTITATPLSPAAQLGYTYAYAGVVGDQADPYTYNNGAYAETIVRNRPVTSTPVPPPRPPAFDLAGAIKKCKKKFRGKKRANCIKKARKRAAKSAEANPGSFAGHPFAARKRPPVLRGAEFRAFQRSRRLP